MINNGESNLIKGLQWLFLLFIYAHSIDNKVPLYRVSTWSIVMHAPPFGIHALTFSYKRAKHVPSLG